MRKHRRFWTKRIGMAFAFPLLCAAQSWTPGEVTRHTTSGEYQISYHVAIPETFDPDNPPPMLVLFSPNGNGKSVLKAVQPSAFKLGWIVVGVDQLKNKMEEKLECAMESEVFETIMNVVPHHPRRIYLGGMSGGAMRAYGLSYKYEDSPIAGILAMGGWLGGPEYYDEDFRKYMAVAMVNGDSDDGANSWVDKDIDVLEDRRCSVEVFTFPGGHQIGPESTLDEALSWMDQDWDKRGSRKQKK